MRARIAGLALVLAVALVGCTLMKPETREQAAWPGASEEGGKVLRPRRCMLTVLILARPLKDELLNDALWRVVDEQAIGDPEALPTLAANGLRVGRVTG